MLVGRDVVRNFTVSYAIGFETKTPERLFLSLVFHRVVTPTLPRWPFRSYPFIDRIFDLCLASQATDYLSILRAIWIYPPGCLQGGDELGADFRIRIFDLIDLTGSWLGD